MTNNALHAIYEAIGKDETTQITLERIDDKLVRMVIVPLLGKAPDNLSQEAANTRAALATPLVLRGEPEEIFADLGKHMEEYRQVRASLRTSQSALEGLKEAADRAKAAVTKAKQEKGKPAVEKTAETKAAPKPEPEAAPKPGDEKNPESLF
jgi:PRTRC genetic system protein E